MPDPAEARAGRWADLRLRIASAAVLLPLALGCLWLGGRVWDGLVILGALGMLLEWRRMERGHLRPAALALLALILPAALAMIWLRADATAGRGNVLFVLVVVWATDIGAYVAGRLLGGPPLAPRISPRKTWAGAAGGLLAAAAVGAVAGRAWGAGVAALLSVLAQLGDLTESAAKRHAGVKDSSHLIPGHGGLLDRLDGLLAAAPAAGILSLAFGPGIALWR